jgi:hypothetical protein
VDPDCALLHAMRSFLIRLHNAGIFFFLAVANEWCRGGKFESLLPASYFAFHAEALQ